MSTAVSLEYEDRGEQYFLSTRPFNLLIIISASECIDMEVNVVEMQSDSPVSDCAREINELGSLVGVPRLLDEADHGMLDIFALPPIHESYRIC